MFETPKLPCIFPAPVSSELNLLGRVRGTHPISESNISLLREPIRFGQFEFCKIESGRNGASDQRPVAAALGRLPRLSGHDRLRLFAGAEMGTEPDRTPAAVIGDVQGQRAAGVIMPNLDCIDAVPVRALAVRQQEIDRRRCGASAGAEAGVAKRLAIVAAFGMRSQFKPRDDVGSGWRRVHQDLFLRSRSSRKTSAALWPFIRRLAATDGSSARRNTLAFFSSASRVGTVGWLSARSRATSAARAFSATLPGSTVSANLMLAAVYY